MAEPDKDRRRYKHPPTPAPTTRLQEIALSLFVFFLIGSVIALGIHWLLT